MSTTRTRRSFPLVLAVSVAAVAACSSPGDDAPPANDVEATPAQELLTRSIAFHDPDGVWSTRPVSLSWDGTGADGGERVAMDITMHPDGSTFAMSGRYRGREIDYSIADGRMTVSVDGSAEIPEPTLEEMRLHREDGMFWRSYYGFLAGLPMKLLDPGTHIDPNPVETEFMGESVLALRVTYDADVGGDTWYFYFDPETAELVGCRFYHDESLNDGEYIVFEDLVSADELRLPKRRSWYVNADSSYLGSDELSELVVGQ